jgi:hypothetical protein
MTTKMTFHPEWTELIELLASHRVRFLIVGAYALAINGRPRATRDLDILIEPTSANAKRFGAAVAEYGYKELAKVWRKFAVRDRMATIGLEPLAVDIMTSISGVDFAQAWKGRAVGKLGRCWKRSKNSYWHMLTSIVFAVAISCLPVTATSTAPLLHEIPADSFVVTMVQSTPAKLLPRASSV